MEDALFARISFCRLLVTLASTIESNIFGQTLEQWTELVNSLKKMLFVLGKSHSRFFGSWRKECETSTDRLIGLKRLFFNPKFLMTLKAQSSVKSQYDPHFDYFRKSDADCTEQFSRNPLDAINFFQNGNSRSAQKSPFW